MEGGVFFFSLSPFHLFFSFLLSSFRSCRYITPDIFLLCVCVHSFLCISFMSRQHSDSAVHPLPALHSAWCVCVDGLICFRCANHHVSRCLFLSLFFSHLDYAYSIIKNPLGFTSGVPLKDTFLLSFFIHSTV